MIDIQRLSPTAESLVDDATALVRRTQFCSVSQLQRRFRLGFARAVQLRDLLEVRGVIERVPGSSACRVIPMIPRRFQRSRVKGWRMPEGAVYVGRPSQWGNPWRVRRHGDGCEGWAVIDCDSRVVSCWPARTRDDYDPRTLAHQEAVDLYTEQRLASISRETIVETLAGRDLVCWCPLDVPCHADVLLEIAQTEVV